MLFVYNLPTRRVLNPVLFLLHPNGEAFVYRFLVMMKLLLDIKKI